MTDGTKWAVCIMLIKEQVTKERAGLEQSARSRAVERGIATPRCVVFRGGRRSRDREGGEVRGGGCLPGVVVLSPETQP